MKNFLVFALAGAFVAHAEIKTATVKDLPYSSVAERCALDLRYPQDMKGFPTVVWFHGGGLSGGKKNFINLSDPRIAVAAVNYRLGPGAAYPAYLQDAASAVAWTLRNISRYGGDPRKVFVSGHSAGGYLTAMIGMDPQWLAPHGFSPLDLAGLAPISGQMTKHFAVKKWLGDKGEQFRPLVDECSPLYYCTKKIPPISLILGDRKIEWPARVEENELLAASLRKLGAPHVEFHEISGYGHGNCVTPGMLFLRSFVQKFSGLEPYREVDPQSAISVLYKKGEVSDAESLFSTDGKTARLVYPKGGEKPIAALDFGPLCVEGYAVITVVAKEGDPVLRLSYANHPDGLSETGDFTYETRAMYMGKECILPALPANVYRHETYTLRRTGKFIAPLLQGQTRYVRLQLDTEGTSAEIDSIKLLNATVCDNMPVDGSFTCSDSRLSRLWNFSVRTVQLAAFPNADAWKTVDGWLLPRKLTCGDSLTLTKTAETGDAASIHTHFELRSNPRKQGAFGLAFGMKDGNGHLVTLSPDGTYRRFLRHAGKDKLCAEKKGTPLLDSVPYTWKIAFTADSLCVTLDGKELERVSATPALSAHGRMGIYAEADAWPMLDSFTVCDAAGHVVFEDGFDDGPEKWAIAKTLPFISDGGKRDRLIWSGDLYWAQRNSYYAFLDPLYMAGSLKMMAFNQTPEGYVQACPYADNTVPPKTGDYGPFPSDEFAAWLVPVAADHYLYTGDLTTVRKIYPAIRKLMEYLNGHMGKNGLFVQRKETSKHACNLNLGDVSTRAYMNILLWKSLVDAAYLANAMGCTADAAVWTDQSEKLKKAVFQNFWDTEKEFFRLSLSNSSFGFEANALALSFRMVTPEMAAKIEPRLVRNGHGKFQALAARGKFEYGFSEQGVKAIEAHNWLQLLNPAWKGAVSTSECMGLNTKGWGDDSHPDTAINGLFSSYLLGIVPVEPGFTRFTVRPQPTSSVTWAKGRVPTPNGCIEADWTLTNGCVNVRLVVPTGTCADVVLPPAKIVRVNGKPRSLSSLPPGRYEIRCE